MKIKKLLAVIMSAVILLTAMSGTLSAYALTMCETQYTYDSPNLSWLKDLIVKEDMTSVDGLSQRNTIIAKSSYPYDETAESFKEEVAYYQTLYTLDENMADVIYIYMMELAMSFAGSDESGHSDEFIRAYLESLGIVYPAGKEDSEETRIVARALFSIVSKDESYVVKRGTGLYEAFTAYISTLLGVDIGMILQFDADSDLSDLKEYVTAACKYLLFCSGYDVSAGTSEEEVYRLIAIMTIRAQGISIDSSTATLEEIKNKYLCAMICKMYDVSINVDGFSKAVKENNLAFYLLQLIGKENGVTVRDSVSYDEAFEIVCENTDAFRLEEGEFYADIFEYDVQLKYKRDAIWLYPQTLGVTDSSEGTQVNVLIDGSDVRENYYVEVPLDSEKAEQKVVITVEYTDKTGKISSSYQLNIRQGATEAVSGGAISDALDGVKDAVTEVLEDLGFDSSFSNIVETLPFELPQRLLSIASLLLPSFDNLSLGAGFLAQLFGYSKDDDSNVDTEDIGGVGGLDAFDQSQDSSQSMDFGHIDIGNLNINIGKVENTTKPANTVVIPETQFTYPQNNASDSERNWFEELISDTQTVVILIVILVVTFGICLALFLKLLDSKKAGAKDKKNKDN